MNIILVVLYGKEINSSQTIYSLSKQKKTNKDIKIIVFNNGPNLLNESCKLLLEKLLIDKFTIEISEDVSNKPLSVLYNDVIERNYQDLSSLIVLDDDTNLPENYIENIHNGEKISGIVMPIIAVGTGDKERIFYPYINNKIIGVQNRVVNDKENVSIKSITSGLYISKDVINVFINNYGKVFDESYALYGVDSSFFARVNRINKENKILKISTGSVIYHDLSRVTQKKNISNLKERYMDMGISCRNYNETFGFYEAFKLLVKSILRGRFSLIIFFLKGYVNGQHPRVRAWKHMRSRDEN